MNSEYNLIEEHWIPCLTKDKSIGRQELGIKQTLLDAHKIEEIQHESPLVIASLHRLLLTIIHRCYGPKTEEDWSSIWENKRFPPQRIETYFDKWKNRFYLFHPTHPFYQVPDYKEKSETHITKLAQELVTGNNETLFDHSHDKKPANATYSEAARLVVATQSFAVGEAQGRVNAPMNYGASILIKGDNLFKTLMLNLITYDPESELPDGIPSGKKDAPHWEKDPIKPKTERNIEGYLDYMTWQTRAIHLLPENGRVNKMFFGQGVKWPKEVAQIRDPTFAHISIKDKGEFPISLQKDRELWRDSTVILQTRQGSSSGPMTRPPLAISEMAEKVGTELQPADIYSLDIFGLCRKDANVHFWRHSRMPLPAIALDNPDIVQPLQVALNMAERGWGLIKEILRFILTETESDEAVKGKRGQERLKKQLHIYSHYWSYLEISFKEWFIEISNKAVENELDGKDSINEWYKKAIEPAIMQSYAKIEKGLSPKSRNLKILVHARKKLYIELGSMKKKEGIDV